MNDNIVNIAKAAGANVASWLMTFSTIKLAEAGMVISILAGLGSVTVSIYSVRWIKQQMKAHEKDHASRD